MSAITIYHNPQCGTSRNVLALIRHCGIEPTVIHYLENPPDETTLRYLLAKMAISPQQLLRRNVAPYHDLGLDNDNISDEQIIAAMLQQPILINRPIVISEKGCKLCRPSEAVLDIMPVALPTVFYKEDGEAIYPR
ncbi:arsenate reductase (glutaredoxin) [Pasteurellaceae bacterium USgator11]|nr:arsenate reductase (glutaredoxin) [Pasteurellaceae bacterium USgator41]TNG94301.1 arsenate reductase (glutaredoxin) [Pasteurellaceae bacterium UScroc12]TNG98519.1 arsenate reductase (glutaredoxin) [Pasteurellaceae bacterium USgator11]TNH01885.1 arsenate reductase (glutaredoxin) [Pasteurellaceae bacterium UScroc31]